MGQFLGITEVEQPKGTDMVRVAVRKMKFQRHIKKSEGQKTPKVELQISIYGVKILEPKTKEMLHNCQLHRMSFCADDKTDKRIFTFICTEPETKTHLCYVFDSEKCVCETLHLENACRDGKDALHYDVCNPVQAEEITLAIGQAFDLAYKKFLESGGKDVETRKQIGNLQKRILDLEMENSQLKRKLKDLEEQLMDPHCSPAHRPSAFSCCGDVTSLSRLEISSVSLTPVSSPDSSQSESLLTLSPAKPAPSQPSGHLVPWSRAGSIQVRVPSTDIFDMVPFTPVSPLARRFTCNGFSSSFLATQDSDMDLFGAEPFDPFISGPAIFTPDIQNKLDEMQVSTASLSSFTLRQWCLGVMLRVVLKYSSPDSALTVLFGFKLRGVPNGTDSGGGCVLPGSRG
ncbi:hypothetical protein DNTS_000687 [Danionella cerebrum]|uniref:PID domain-containing protein n=1 Tax=Danionella cerebrum TaxID=2873325 RepID=A0A553PZS6_9TELE|nr:hypothetical protein DNTS_000687 [Danionella translucida]